MTGTDPRHDPEAALLQIKSIRTWGPDDVAAADADDEARASVEATNRGSAAARAADMARWADGRLYIIEAAEAIARQQGFDAHEVLVRLRFAANDLRPDGSRRLRVRDPATWLQLAPHERAHGAHGVSVGDVNAWLDADGAGYRLPVGVGSAAGAPPKPLPRAAAHEAAILHALRQAGFDPLRLPDTPAGKASPAKQAARRALPKMTRAVLDGAWKRLRSQGELK